mmetsp:Transcript_47989/g.127139  ORF Transcript_47989/g.127139 Transcript_47989/m.127139 type:complete len:101 (-) Transcript_47989:363-665(-)
MQSGVFSTAVGLIHTYCVGSEGGSTVRTVLWTRPSLRKEKQSWTSRVEAIKSCAILTKKEKKSWASRVEETSWKFPRKTKKSSTFQTENKKIRMFLRHRT